MLVISLLGTFLLHAYAAEPTQRPQQLLGQLHAERDEIRSNPRSSTVEPTRPDLSPLIGLDRDQLASGLGAPDFCVPPSEHTCRLSPHWAYFFYRWEPSAREASSGMMEVRIPLRGWAVELDLSKDGVVNRAAWAKQQ
jgi:hypothetical protein